MWEAEGGEDLLGLAVLVCEKVGLGEPESVVRVACKRTRSTNNPRDAIPSTSSAPSSLDSRTRTKGLTCHPKDFVSPELCRAVEVLGHRVVPPVPKPVDHRPVLFLVLCKLPLDKAVISIHIAREI